MAAELDSKLDHRPSGALRQETTGILLVTNVQYPHGRS
jgi:hypothetical protein